MLSAALQRPKMLVLIVDCTTLLYRLYYASISTVLQSRLYDRTNFAPIAYGIIDCYLVDFTWRLVGGSSKSSSLCLCQ